jgi:hypothetical protein
LWFFNKIIWKDYYKCFACGNYHPPESIPCEIIFDKYANKLVVGHGFNDEQQQAGVETPLLHPSSENSGS